MDRVEKVRALRKKLGRYRQQHDNDKERPTMQTGVLRWVGLGKTVDAIGAVEKEIAEIDKEVEKLRNTPGRIGTGESEIAPQETDCNAFARRMLMPSAH